MITFFLINLYTNKGRRVFVYINEKLSDISQKRVFFVILKVIKMVAKIRYLIKVNAKDLFQSNQIQSNDQMNDINGMILNIKIIYLNIRSKNDYN